MRRLIKPTELLRATVQAAVAREVLGPDHSLPPGAVRTVTILVPAAPQLSVAIDTTSRDVAGGRNYTMIDMPPGKTVVMNLQPQQSLLFLATTAQCEAGIIVEYWIEDLP